MITVITMISAFDHNYNGHFWAKPTGSASEYIRTFRGEWEAANWIAGEIMDNPYARVNSILFLSNKLPYDDNLNHNCEIDDEYNSHLRTNELRNINNITEPSFSIDLDLDDEIIDEMQKEGDRTNIVKNKIIINVEKIVKESLDEKSQKEKDRKRIEAIAEQEKQEKQEKLKEYAEKATLAALKLKYESMPNESSLPK